MGRFVSLALKIKNCEKSLQNSSSKTAPQLNKCPLHQQQFHHKDEHPLSWSTCITPSISPDCSHLKLSLSSKVVLVF